MRRRLRSLAIVCAVLSVLAWRVPLSARQAATTSPLTLDVVAVRSDGRPVDGLGPGDFSVTVDGQPRRVLSVVHVSRGPGADSQAASRRASSSAAAVFATEPSRVVFVVVDQTMLGRGDARPAIQAATALVDRLGLDDRIAIVRLPMITSARIEATTDRPAVREALAKVVGQAIEGRGTSENNARRESPGRPATVDPDRAAAGDPDKTIATAERERALMSAEAAPAIGEGDTENVQATLGGLASLLAGFRTVPGRKSVALLSAGLPSASRSVITQIDQLADAAAAARTVIHAFRLRVSRVVDGQAPANFLPLERLAMRTGGSAVDVEQIASGVDRVLMQLSACYVITLEGARTDGNGRANAVRVQTTRKDVILRTASAVALRSDPEERVVADTAPEAPAPRVAARDSARETEMALSLMTDYVRGYQQAFSGLVAEEAYSQRRGSREVLQRSDFLLVNVGTTGTWVSFRDVFEVDGKPVRDREDRLKRLFLENPAAEAMAQVRKIQEESARVNVGPVSRNINEPLFPLTILLPDNRPRFHCTLARKTTANGLPVWKIEYKERVRPTLIKNRANEDVPAEGYFLMDPATGAVVETSVDATERTVVVHLLVHYRHDATLGLWVPADMTEEYRSRPQHDLVMTGKATYSNFRRFQVKTEEKMTIPK